MFAYRFTKNTTNWLMNLLARFINKQRVEKWRAATLAKIDTFYTESQKLKKRKKEIVDCFWFNGFAIAFLLFNSIYGFNCSQCSVLMGQCNPDEYYDYHVYGNYSDSGCIWWCRI